MTRFVKLVLGVAVVATAVVGSAWPVARLAAQAPDLAALEAAVTAAPDELRPSDDYRKAVIKSGQFDRAIAFFEKLAASHPQSSNAQLNYGFAYVDKIPAAGSITQVILANTALTAFTKSLEIRKTWIGYYTRGNSYLFWPRIFGRTSLALADLDEALKIQNAEPKKAYHARTYVALGDGYWKIDEFDKATAAWKKGLELFPDNTALKDRLAKPVDQLKPLMDNAYDPAKRVDTSLQDLWSNQ